MFPRTDGKSISSRLLSPVIPYQRADIGCPVPCVPLCIHEAATRVAAWHSSLETSHDPRNDPYSLNRHRTRLDAPAGPDLGRFRGLWQDPCGPRSIWAACRRPRRHRRTEEHSQRAIAPAWSMAPQAPTPRPRVQEFPSHRRAGSLTKHDPIHGLQGHPPSRQLQTDREVPWRTSDGLFRSLPGSELSACVTAA